MLITKCGLVHLTLSSANKEGIWSSPKESRLISPTWNWEIEIKWHYCMINLQGHMTTCEGPDPSCLKFQRWHFKQWSKYLLHTLISSLPSAKCPLKTEGCSISYNPCRTLIVKIMTYSIREFLLLNKIGSTSMKFSLVRLVMALQKIGYSKWHSLNSLVVDVSTCL